jgi:hypothetical protein
VRLPTIDALRAAVACNAIGERPLCARSGHSPIATIAERAQSQNWRAGRHPNRRRSEKSLHFIRLFSLSEAGDPGMTRTCDLRFRKPSLYPAELRDRRPALRADAWQLNTRAGGLSPALEFGRKCCEFSQAPSPGHDKLAICGPSPLSRCRFQCRRQPPAGHRCRCGDWGLRVRCLFYGRRYLEAGHRVL